MLDAREGDMRFAVSVVLGMIAVNAPESWPTSLAAIWALTIGGTAIWLLASISRM